MVEPQLEAHPERTAEQAHVDHAYACLAGMRRRAEAVRDLGFMGVSYADGMVSDAETWESHMQRRVDLLAETPAALCFGRIDSSGDERWYIGRRHVEDDRGDPVVTDWRAPVSAPFYRATVADPLGLRLRRRFLIEGRDLVDLFDEDFTDPDTVDAAAYVPDPLLAELERARTGEMRDIVATIQAEQDVIIRAPLEACIVVQGGPGTGKTAVGLHRAAFLLYEHRELLEQHRLLIVGPNKIFLRYISQVLPSLGETASVQLTIEGLAGSRYRLRAEDPPDLARLKGDGRMVEVLVRAVRAHLAPPAGDTRVTTGFGTVVLPAPDATRLVAAALDGDRPVNVGREVLRERLLALAWQVQSTKPTADPAHQASFTSEVRADRAFRALLDRTWPAMSSAAVVRRLLGNRRFLARTAGDLLTRGEQDLLARKPARRVADEPWTRSDLGLLDEVEAILNGTVHVYGHVVVDEAQDLSSMELRMVARRSRGGSMTVLGDLAQATAPAAQLRWEDALAQLPGPARLEELEVGYRVPAPILEFANRLLVEAAPHVVPARSVRLRGEPPRVLEVDPPSLGRAVADEVAAAATTWSSVGVVAPLGLLDHIRDALAARDVEHVDARRGLALGEHVTLLGPVATKGLEFDAVVVAEPGRIAVEEPGGARTLYVVLTRAVQHLSIVHADPLPAALRTGEPVA